MTPLDPIALTQDLVRIDSRNPPGGEDACASLLASVLSDRGFEVTRHEFGPGRTNLIATFPDRDKTAPLTVFTGHLDTVPFGSETWAYPPLGGDIIDGKIYGRGTSDMKAGVAAMVAAFASRMEAGHHRQNAMLVLTGGEETGCDGARALVADQSFPTAALLVVGEPTDNAVLSGHKGALWFRGCCHGKTAHGAMPHLGENAIYKAAHALAKLERYRFEAQPDPVMGEPSLNVGTITGGLNVNSVPDLAEFTLDIRSVPGIANAEIIADIERLLAEDVAIDRLLDLAPVWSDPETDLILRIRDMVQAITGRPWRPTAANYFTDASVLQGALGGAQTIIMGPGKPELAHQTNEYCTIERLIEAVGIYSAVLGMGDHRAL